MPKDRDAEQGDVDGHSECSLALGWWQPKHGCALPPSRLRATFHGLLSKTHWKNSGCRQSTQATCRKVSTLQLGGLAKLNGADDPRHAPQENGGLADLWHIDDGDILCHPISVASCLQDCDDANDNVGAERHPQKTEVICHVADLDAAPPEYERGAFACLNLSGRWKQHARSRYGTPSVHRGPTLGQSRRHSSNARTCLAVSGSADRICSLSREFWCQPYQPHPSAARPHDPAGETCC